MLSLTWKKQVPADCLSVSGWYFQLCTWSVDDSKRVTGNIKHLFLLKLTRSCAYYICSWKLICVFFIRFLCHASCNPHIDSYVHGLMQTDP